MCVSPVFCGYNIWRQSLESMEMARMLGVDHVNVYVEKAGRNLTRVLQYYVDQGFMSVFPWNDIPSNVHAHAQVGCMHDCLLRMRYVTKYVVFIDLDELIILRTNNTLREMVEHVLKQTKDADKVGAIMVRNSFFHHAPQEKINITDTYLQANLTRGLFTKARLYDLKSVLMQFRGKAWKPPQRCRTIADPLRVDTMAVHYPQTMFGNFKVIVVDPKIGLLHHYRYGWHNEDTVRDTTAHRLTPILVNRLEAVYKQLP
ncbi:glycosyltransferase family 92 protein F13G3.3-like [Pomacea canaliculata]|nr:glycosyltransferase family 92 protein F13G3.3-like [Pomacea canaliculata]